MPQSILKTAEFWKTINVQRPPDIIKSLPSSTNTQIKECRWKRYNDSDFCVLVIKENNQNWGICPEFYTRKG